MIGQVLERFGLREAPVELTDWQVTVLLLDVPEEWRQRAVEEVSLQTEGLYRVRRSVQFAPLLDVVEEAGFRVEKKEQAAVLPLWLMPKAPLLEFDITGPDGKPAHLVSRTDTSLRQVEFLAALSGIEGVDIPQDVAGVLFGVGRFTPGRLDGPKELRKERVEQRAYALELAFGGSFEAAQVDEWESRCAEWGTRLAEIIGEPAHPESSSENPLLALLDGPFAEQTAADVGRLLDAYLSWLDRLAEAGAVRVLWWVATFGRRYYALVEVKVDPERPGLLKMTERRELALDKGWVRSAWRLPARQYRCSVELETKVASSYHLRVRSDDESVSPSGPPTMTAGDGSRVGSTYVDGTAVGADGYALYMSDPARPGHVTLTVPLRLSGDVRRSLTLAYGLAFAARPRRGTPRRPRQVRHQLADTASHLLGNGAAGPGAHDPVRPRAQVLQVGTRRCGRGPLDRLARPGRRRVPARRRGQPLIPAGRDDSPDALTARRLFNSAAAGVPHGKAQPRTGRPVERGAHTASNLCTSRALTGELSGAAPTLVSRHPRGSFT